MSTLIKPRSLKVPRPFITPRSAVPVASQTGGDPVSVALAGMGGGIALGNYNYVGAVHQNVPLTNLIVGYDVTQNFIADTVFPALPVVNESDDYYSFDKSPWFRREETRTPDRQSAREVQFQFTKGSYTADRFALATSISDRERRNADDQLRLEESSLQLIKQLVMMDIEIRVATLLSKANTSGVTISGTSQWDNASYNPPTTGLTIEQSVDTGKEAIRQATGGLDPTHIIIPSATAKVVKRDAKVRDLIKYTHADLLVDGDLPPKLWGMNVLVPRTIYTTTPEGTAEASVTYTDIWGKDVRLLYVPPVPGIRVPATGYQFRVGGGENWGVYQWRDDRARCDYFETGVLEDLKLTNATSCYVIETPIA